MARPKNDIANGPGALFASTKRMNPVRLCPQSNALLSRSSARNALFPSSVIVNSERHSGTSQSSLNTRNHSHAPLSHKSHNSRFSHLSIKNGNALRKTAGFGIGSSGLGHPASLLRSTFVPSNPTYPTYPDKKTNGG